MHAKKVDGVQYMQAGDRVEVVPVDPWDLVTAIGSGPFRGTVIAVDESSRRNLILSLDEAVVYCGLIGIFFLAYTRHGERFDATPGRPLICNLRSLSKEEANDGFSPQGAIAGAIKANQLRLSFTGDVTWAEAGPSLSG